MLHFCSSTYLSSISVTYCFFTLLVLLLVFFVASSLSFQISTYSFCNLLEKPFNLCCVNLLLIEYLESFCNFPGFDLFFHLCSYAFSFMLVCTLIACHNSLQYQTRGQGIISLNAWNEPLLLLCDM